MFNLYGGINKLMYSHKGVTEWEEIQEIIDGKLYFLQENYRNTAKITQYCND